MQRSNRLTATALSIFFALALFCSIHAETIIVDSFDGPEVDLHDDGNTIALLQKDVENVLGGRRMVFVNGTSGRPNSLVIRDGQLTVKPTGGEGVSLKYYSPEPLNESFELDAQFEMDFKSAPWTSPQTLIVQFFSDTGDTIAVRRSVDGGEDFTFSVLASDFVSNQPEVNPLVVLNDVDGIHISVPGWGPYTISEVRVNDDRNSPPGDFNFNGELDVNDINLLTDQIREKQTGSRFDLNEDGIVELHDLDIWGHDLKHTWFGDVNLDGEFNSGDLTEVFAAGKFETEQNASWAEGDWDADGAFGTGDLVVAFQDGGFEQGPRASVSTIPEPSTALLLILAAMCTVPRTRRKRF